jgi:hypothetical protein
MATKIDHGTADIARGIEQDRELRAPHPLRGDPAFRIPLLPAAALGVLAFACSAAVGFASARHTGSLAFPIDDAYIYSNYVLSASQGHPFTYNAGEVSGGITGLAWYIMLLLAYWLLAPFHTLLGGLAPDTVGQNAQLAQQAGHLYLAAYLAGAVCLALTAVGVYWLASLALPPAHSKPLARNALCWLLGAAAAADLGLVWGAMSGLEVSLSAAVSVWAIAFLLAEVRRGRLRVALLLAALLPWARPDLLAIGFAGLVWLVWRAVREAGAQARRPPFAMAGAYLLALVAGFGAMSLVYYLGWGKPLPSSFYAKVSVLRLSGKFFAAAQEFVIAGRFLPFVAGALAMAGGILQWLAPARSSEEGTSRRESSLAALLLLLVSVIYTAALMVTLPWFGQEDRYLLPLHPFVIVLLGMLAWRILGGLPLERPLAQRSIVFLGGLGLIVLLALGDYVWATRVYAVEVRNIEDAHIKPALWIAASTPADSVVASEPIGAVKLFSGRRTVDLVGLTTPATLGTFEDWPRAWPALKAQNAAYLLFYPDWFTGHKPPGWASESARFQIPDNRIAGADVIAVYELDWDRFASSSAP